MRLLRSSGFYNKGMSWHLPACGFHAWGDISVPLTNYELHIRVERAMVLEGRKKRGIDTDVDFDAGLG